MFGEPRRRISDWIFFVTGCLFLLSGPSIDHQSGRLPWTAFVSMSASALLQGAAELLPQRWTTSAGVMRKCLLVLSLVFLILLILDLVS
ncbi:MAG: hypothetical protein CYG60_09560 [Actinobacteria bacterium]|nr:MAG: hypothetical protein CYG60_09560 [Actinomycetota bacterium]